MNEMSVYVTRLVKCKFGITLRPGTYKAAYCKANGRWNIRVSPLVIVSVDTRVVRG